MPLAAEITVVDSVNDAVRDVVADTVGAVAGLPGGFSAGWGAAGAQHRLFIMRAQQSDLDGPTPELLDTATVVIVVRSYPWLHDGID